MAIVYITAALVLALLAFYVWMFQDMLNSQSLPPCFISFSNRLNPRLDWTYAFLLLNIFAAAYYYLAIYRQGKL